MEDLEAGELEQPCTPASDASSLSTTDNTGNILLYFLVKVALSYQLFMIMFYFIVIVITVVVCFYFTLIYSY